MSDNMISFTGWVGSAVELTEVSDGVQVASFRVGSTPRRLRNGQWEDCETLWHTVKVWRSLAVHAAASLRVGDAVFVAGRMAAESWTNADDVAMTRQVVVASTVGHDLTRGTSTFRRASRRAQVPGAGAPAAAASLESALEASAEQAAELVAGGAPGVLPDHTTGDTAGDTSGDTTGDTAGDTAREVSEAA